MEATANAAGFTVATDAEVAQLTDTLPLTGGQWSSYAAVMGSAPNRALMWGADDPNGTGIWGEAYAYSTYTSWAQDSGYGGDEIGNNGTEFADEDIWAFTSGASNAVPEPSSLPLMLAGLGLIGGAVYFGRKKATTRI